MTTNFANSAGRCAWTGLLMLAALVSAPSSAGELRPFQLPPQPPQPTVFTMPMPAANNPPPSVNAGKRRRSPPSDWSDWSADFNHRNDQYKSLLDQLQ